MDRQDRKRLSLFTPGPVELSPPAKRALARGVLHHRTEAFKEALVELEARLKAVFLTEHPVATLTSSGTGAMEAAVVNLFAPGEKVLVPVSGKFSSRWAEICASYGVDVCRLDLEPGQAPEPESVSRILIGEPDVAGVMLTHCETSTGSLTDVEAVCRAVRDVEERQGRRILTCIDCVTSLCIDEFRMDDWYVDCALAASQKGFLAPPGLAFLAANRDALERMEQERGPRYYFDLRRYFEDIVRSPFTPAVNLVTAVNESLESILDLGLPRIWKAYRSSAAAVRLIVESAGFRPVAVSQAGGAVAFRVDSVGAEALAAAMRERCGIVVAGGQGDLKGRILRVSTIGKGPGEIVRFAGCLASVLKHMGRSLDLDGIQADLERILEDSAVWESLR